MILIHGAYHFWPKRVAFRNDYCLSCRAPSRSIAVRTFDVGHIFWIPVLPVGFWKHWRCIKCGEEPHTSPGTRRSFKWIGLAILILFSVVSWVEPVAAPDEWISWLFRIGGPAASLLLLRHLLRSPKEVSLRQGFKTVVPADDTVCPFCGTPLLAGPRWSCPACGVLRY
jgi:hypothetical protein